MLTAQDKEQLLRIRDKVKNRLTVSVEEKQWVIDMHIKARKAVPVGQALFAHAQGFRIQGLPVHQ